MADEIKVEEIPKYHVTYFPLEQKYSVWDKEYNLIKEWFDTREEAQRWIGLMELEVNDG